MKHLLLLLACFTLADGISSAQDKAKASDTVTSKANVLSRLVGKWNTTSQPVSDNEVAPAPYTGTMEATMLGKHWLICEYDADMGGVKFNAMQRLRYDSKKDAYPGTWVDSFFDYEWQLEGNFKNNRLTVNSEGPNPAKPGSTSKFRDIYEFKTADLILTISEMQTDAGEWQAFMTGEFRRVAANNTDKQMTSQTTMMPFLMFVGQAEEAMTSYTALFPDAKIISKEKYGAGDTGKEGTIKQAIFELAGQKVMCTDSPPVHEFTFTPSFSFFVECESEERLDDLFAKLSKDGKVMMPPGDYGFSKKFCWTSDRFGVSWQLNLAK